MKTVGCILGDCDNDSDEEFLDETARMPEI